MSKGIGQINKKFGLKATPYTIEWKDLDQHRPYIDELVQTAIQDVLDDIFAEGRPNDLVNVMIDHDALVTPIPIPFSKQEKLTAHKIVLQIKKVQQSRRELDFDSMLRFKFTRMRRPDNWK